MVHRINLSLQFAKRASSLIMRERYVNPEVRSNYKEFFMPQLNTTQFSKEPQHYVPAIKFRNSAFTKESLVDDKSSQKRVSSISMSWADFAAFKAKSKKDAKEEEKLKPRKLPREDWEMPRRYKMNKSVVLKPKQEYLSIAAPK